MTDEKETMHFLAGIMSVLTGIWLFIKGMFRHIEKRISDEVTERLRGVNAASQAEILGKITTLEESFVRHIDDETIERRAIQQRMDRIIELLAQSNHGGAA